MRIEVSGAHSITVDPAGKGNGDAVAWLGLVVRSGAAFVDAGAFLSPDLAAKIGRELLRLSGREGFA
jgi:hypothetical protein